MLVRLGTKALHGGALAAVEHAHLQCGPVRVDAHFSAQRVYLAHEVTLRRSADGRVARHKGDAVQIEREHHRFDPRPRKGKGGLAPRVPRADDDRVVFGCVKFVADHIDTGIFTLTAGNIAFVRAQCFSESL